ncbi:LRR receptor-like serine/threonine-protein kinase GSO1 [Abrus precatorius]|uniref:LRR receptor-like serine/threonine-protein kinase GSO1 n=1 Tax=Abrus precatorius TaxID=3816 RepID=A0A8B8MMG7_ABRPR|nr:LRR receptor-like serine/threonine-protein kinase GSO1 [Abrus precatorius]
MATRILAWRCHFVLCFVLLILFCLCKGQDFSLTPMKKKEQVVIYRVIQGFVGKWWNGSYLYPDPCGWTPIQGVSCEQYDDGFWYVTAINFGPVFDNYLTCNHGAHLRKLQSLVLLENGLTGKLPPSIGKLVKLKQLVLAGNYLVGEVPMSYGGFSELLIFDASRNKLSGVLPSTIGLLDSILKIDLSYNMLQGELPRELGRLKNLTLLDISHNKLSGGLATLKEMVSLKDLVLSNNPIGGDLLGIRWEIFQNIEALDLSNMGLVGIVPESMAEMKRLRFLDLSNNNLSGSLSRSLENLPCLRALHINGNNLAGRLDFSERFYSKTGMRFAAWNNANLCYIAKPTRQIPDGLKPCFEVGGKDGWVVPKDNAQTYNQWASENRFKVNDTLRFKYENDSVMVVTEEEYEKCKSSHPIFFSNNGDTVFKFDRPGLFFFISGVSGHCNRGEKMIIKVLDLEAAPSPQSANESAQQSPSKSGISQMTPMNIITIFVMSIFGMQLYA